MSKHRPYHQLLHILHKDLAATPGSESEKAEAKGEEAIVTRGQMVRAQVSIREILKTDSTESGLLNWKPQPINCGPFHHTT